MDITIPADAIKILVDQLDEVLSAVSRNEDEKRYQNLPEKVVGLIDASKKLAGEGNIEEAISVLNRAVAECPGYSRGRLQIAVWQERAGNTAIALFSAGHAYATATDKDTKCQLLSLSGDLAMSIYRRTRRKQEIKNAITFYSMARKEDDQNPHPIWNMIEAIKEMGGDYAPEVHGLLSQISKNSKASPGSHQHKLKKILADWDNVLGNEFDDWRSKITDLSTVVAEAVNDSQREQRSRLTKRTLAAAALAAGLVLVANGGKLADWVSDSGPTTVVEHSGNPEQSTLDSEKKVKNSNDSSDSKSPLIEAGVEFDDGELKLALGRGIEFDDSELT